MTDRFGGTVQGRPASRTSAAGEGLPNARTMTAPAQVPAAWREGAVFTRGSGMLLLLLTMQTQLLGQQPARKPQPSSRPTSIARPQPSLDALAGRVRSYWALLASGNRRQAVEYVEPSSQEAFLARSTPDFSSPRLAELSLGSRDDEVDVTVYVKRIMPPLAGEFDFPVTERWVLRSGRWFVAIKTGMTPFPSSGTSRGAVEGISPDEVSRRRALLRRELKFTTTELNFGKLNQGTPAIVQLGYRLEGSEPAGIEIVSGPNALDIRGGVSAREVKPGDGALTLEFLTAERDSQVVEPFTIAARRDDVEARFDFVLKGDVYAPVSVIPRPLRFRKGELEAEVTLRNNSGSTIRIERSDNEKAGFSATPIPLTLEPGQTARVKIRRPHEETAPNNLNRVALIFSESVDGRGNVSVPLVLNYVEVAPPKKDALPPEVDEWLRKNQPGGVVPP